MALSTVAAPLPFFDMPGSLTCQMPLLSLLPWRPLERPIVFWFPSFLTVSSASSCLCIFPLHPLLLLPSYPSNWCCPIWMDFGFSLASLLSTSQVKEGFLARAQVLEPFCPGYGVWIREKSQMAGHGAQSLAIGHSTVDRECAWHSPVTYQRFVGQRVSFVWKCHGH